MASSNTYWCTNSYTPGAAANVIMEILAPSTKPIEIIRFSISQVTATTSAALGVLFNRCTAGTTGWTSPATPAINKLNPSDASAGSTVNAYNSAGTSTDGTGHTTNFEEAFNVLNGYLYLPVPEERMIVAAANYLAVKWSVAPPAATVFKWNVVFREVG